MAKCQRVNLKWFNEWKGYGFIVPDGGGPDVFVHKSAVLRARLNSLREGQPLEYDMVDNRAGHAPII